MIRAHAAGERFRSEQPGVTSWHCFSAGAHYDPQRLAFGPVVGCDEHLVEGGAGFDWHGHRGVRICSWVLEGILRHEDDSGTARLVGPGELLVQDARDGLRHAETNASATAPLRFVQLTLLHSELPPQVSVQREVPDSGPSFAYVAGGRFTHPHVGLLGAGDWLEIGDGVSDPVIVEGDGEVLVATFKAVSESRQ